jgi:hypothetical protein
MPDHEPHSHSSSAQPEYFCAKRFGQRKHDKPVSGPDAPRAYEAKKQVRDDGKMMVMSLGNALRSGLK